MDFFRPFIGVRLGITPIEMFNRIGPLCKDDNRLERVDADFHPQNATYVPLKRGTISKSERQKPSKHGVFVGGGGVWSSKCLG